VGYSVLDVVENFKNATNKNIPYIILERRIGDVAECYADPIKAKNVLKWSAEKNIQDMCRDAWRFQVNNPNGY
jgi:UDP-glucose 4-epimerase